MSHVTPARRGRMLVRRGTRDDKAPRVVRSAARPEEGAICRGCDAVYRRKTWRRRPLLPSDRLSAARVLCPACHQVRSRRSFGEVVLRGPAVEGRRDILRRIRHIAERAVFTQPERRVVAIEPRADGVHVLTTSQKLAHRVAVELTKAFGGHARYAWSDRGGRLYSVWDAPEVPMARHAHR
jgi:NMD protein affecting ribosome stability and mRNA decay